MRLLVALSLLAVVACTCDVKPADAEAIRRVYSRFPGEYELKPECFLPGSSDVYVQLHPKRSGRVSRPRAAEIARIFWFGDRMVARNDSQFVYLNVHAARGEFDYQVYWNPERRTFAFSSTDHY